MTLWLIPESGSGKRLRLIDRSFRPCVLRARPGAAPAASGSDARRARPRRPARSRAEDGHLGRPRAASCCRSSCSTPPQFAALARFVSRFDPGLRLYNSDLMLPPLYCWEKGVFPLAKVEVETAWWDARKVPGRTNRTHRDRTPKADLYRIHAIECRDDNGRLITNSRRYEIMQVRLEGICAGESPPRPPRRAGSRGGWRVAHTRRRRRARRGRLRAPAPPLRSRPHRQRVGRFDRVPGAAPAGAARAASRFPSIATPSRSASAAAPAATSATAASCSKRAP